MRTPSYSRWHILLAAVASVEIIRTTDGRSILLGSDEPERLAAFITARLPRRH